MIRRGLRTVATGLALAGSPVLFLLALHLDTTAPEAAIVGVKPPVIKWETEAAMVAAFAAEVAKLGNRAHPNHEFREAKWTSYPETEGWDLLLVREDGLQLGIEAKLALNLEVLVQALGRGRDGVGPDCWPSSAPGASFSL